MNLLTQQTFCPVIVMEEVYILCPYHDSKWRSMSQFIVNDMRRKDLLNSQRIRRLPTAMCICPDKTCSVKLPKLCTIEEITEWKDSLVTTHDKLHTIIEKLLKATVVSKTVSMEYHDGLKRVLSVLYFVYHNNSDFLDPPPIIPAADPPKTDEDLKQTKEEPASIEYLQVEFYLDIPVTPVTYIGTLIGSGGCHLKALCSEHGVHSVHVGDVALNIKGQLKRPKTHIRSSPVKVLFTYEKGKENVLEFKRALTERAQLVCKKRQKHFETGQRFRANKLKRAQERRRRRDQIHNQYSHLLDHKEGASLSVQKHYRNNKKTKHQRAKPPPILQDSKCLQCQQPHSSESKQCVYHPGFTAEVSYKGIKESTSWTCCKQHYRQYSTLAEEHTRTGCAVGIHNWRPVRNQKKSRSKPATNNTKDETEDTVVGQKK